MRNRIIVFMMSLVCSLPTVLFGQEANPMTQAVLNAYDRLLAEDPTDYETYFHRASEFYKRNLYMRALSDIDNAIKYTPESETDLRVQELSLRANINLMTNRKEEALKDFTAAFLLTPNDYVICYQKANLDYELGNYLEAKEGFKRMQRLNSRSVEALVGLARVAVKENNLGLANDYVNKAVEFDKTNSNVYVRRASIRLLLGNNAGSVEDLLVAISLDNNNKKAFRDLSEIANKDYRAVITGISNVIAQVPEQGMYYYIRGYISMEHYHYTSALEDFNYLISNEVYNYDGVFRSRAVCHLNLADFDHAIDDINRAISMTDDNAKSYQIKAEILLATGDYGEAMKCIDIALDKGGESFELNILKGRVQTAKGNYIDATTSFGEASMLNPTRPEPYLWRGYVLKNFLNSPESAKSFFRRAAEANEQDDTVYSLRGFALLELGEFDSANEWMATLLREGDNDGATNYYAACFFSHTGEIDKALDAVATSMAKGFGSRYLWQYYSEGVINVSLLRNDSRFGDIVKE